MAISEEKLTKSRLRSSYISVIISIALVLFVIGTFSLLAINAKLITKQIKENFAISVLLENDASQAEVKQFQKNLELSEYVKSTEFISSEEAAEELSKELDEDFISFLGYNPLSDVIDVHLIAAYVTPEKLQELEGQYAKNNFVKEVVYDKPLIQKMNENIKKLSVILAVSAFLLALISIALINSSIRLAIYSRRFVIKTMQLVGATKSFIRRPFLIRSLRHGLLGSLAACSLMALMVFYLEQNIPGYSSINNLLVLVILGLGIFATGLIISMLCTYFALRKYLNLKTDQLYY